MDIRRGTDIEQDSFAGGIPNSDSVVSRIATLNPTVAVKRPLRVIRSTPEAGAANLLRQVAQDRQRKAFLMATNPHCKTCGQKLTHEHGRDNTAMLDGGFLKCHRCFVARVQDSGLTGEQWTANPELLATAVADLERAHCPKCGRPVKHDAPACYRHLTIVLMRGFRKGGRTC